MIAYIASLFVPHKWTQTDDRRSCSLCGQVEQYEEWDDPIASIQSRWKKKTPGNRKLHLTANQFSQKEEVAAQPEAASMAES